MWTSTRYPELHLPDTPLKEESMNRRTALKTIALATTAAALPPGASAQPAPTAPTGPFVLPPLGYAFDALEPHIDARTMELHHGRHHQSFITNLNKAAAADAKTFPTTDPEALLRQLDRVPESSRTLVRNNAGGHVNHSIFWKTLSTQGGKPSVALAKAIDSDLGGMEAFQKSLSDAAMKVFGSGWAWLSATPAGKLVIESTPNQDNPWMKGNKPLLGIDVWEHAYYLNYQNRRADYVAAFFNIIDWKTVSARHAAKA
jgi:Fe-Mn family superoxide dismutase